MEKERGLWPLPGGFGKYVDTLTGCLTFVKDERPDENRLKQWFFKTFPQMKGEVAVTGYVHTIRKLGLIKKEDQRFVLADQAEKFLETRDNKLLYQMMDERIAGVGDILLMLSKKPCSVSELHQELQRGLNVRWKTTSQVFWRLGWLQSMGYVTKVGRQYSLTEPGRDVVGQVPPPMPSPLPPGYERIIAEKDEEIRRLRSRIEELEKRAKGGPPPEEDVVSSLQRSEQLGWEYLEYNLYRALCEIIGKDNVTWYGRLLDGKPSGAGPGEPDLIIKAPLAGEPYSVVVEGTKATQGYRQTDEVIAARDHGKDANADFTLLVAPNFVNRAERESREKNVLLSTIDGITRVLNYHREVGGITQEELRTLITLACEKDPPQIDTAFDEWKKAVDEQRRTLSLAIEVYDRLYEEKDWIYTHMEVLKRVNRERLKEGLKPLKDEEAPTIQKVLEILVMLGATHFDFENKRYKVSLTREGFGLRIRKLEETIRLHESKQPRRSNKITSWA